MPDVKNIAHARLDGRTEGAFVEAEREGLMLAAKVRTVALSVVLLWQAFDNPDTGLTYIFNLLEIGLFAFIGGLQFFVARQRILPRIMKYVFVLFDCVLLAIIFSAPSPFDDHRLPPAVLMDSARFMYFFMFLMQAAFSFRPLLVLWCGVCIAGTRSGMWLWFVNQPDVFTNLDLPEQSAKAFVEARPDPNFLFLGYAFVEILVTLIVAAGLAVVVLRSRNLVESRILAERKRASLARYFSPNVLDHISNDHDPFSDARQQNVAVLFADIMGFTKLCEHEPADGVVALLREYHNRLGQAVFHNEGTLDKYIGDDLMETFGTPDPSPGDATNALQCAMDMIAELEDWNAERAKSGMSAVRVGIGVHYGDVVAGDIGNERRLEYSVIGNTVNIASRLEHMTRSLESDLVVSDNLIRAIDRNTDQGRNLVTSLTEAGVQEILGRETRVAVWVLRSR